MSAAISHIDCLKAINRLFVKLGSGLRFFLNRLGEKLWVKPLLACVLSIVGVFFAKAADKHQSGVRLMTIDKVARATTSALENREDAPLLNGITVGFYQAGGRAVFSNKVGYVQLIDMGGLQSCAENADAKIELAVLPGAFVAPGRVIAYVHGESPAKSDYDGEQVAIKFLIGNERTFEEGPRYGFVVLLQIAGHALSPAINDPGTAIDIISVMIRLFVLWGQPRTEQGEPKVYYDRIHLKNSDYLSSMENDS